MMNAPYHKVLGKVSTSNFNNVLSTSKYIKDMKLDYLIGNLKYIPKRSSFKVRETGVYRVCIVYPSFIRIVTDSPIIRQQTITFQLVKTDKDHNKSVIKEVDDTIMYYKPSSVVELNQGSTSLPLNTYLEKGDKIGLYACVEVSKALHQKEKNKELVEGLTKLVNTTVELSIMLIDT